MNSTRIRYNKQGEVLVSTKNFVLGGDVFRVDIDSTNINLIKTDGTLFHQRVTDTSKLHVLKLEAKKLLKELGVQFKDEVRVTKPKVE